MIRWLCPYCGRKLKAPESAIGRAGKCPTCRNRITVPPFSTHEGERQPKPTVVGAAQGAPSEEHDPASAEQALRQFFRRVATAQDEGLGPPQQEATGQPEPEASNATEGSTEVKIATIEATIEFSRGEEEAETAEEATVELFRAGERAFPASVAKAWRRRQYRALGIGLAIAASTTVVVEVGLIEASRLLAARTEQTTGDMLALGIWGLALFTIGVVVMWLGYTAPLLVWVLRDAVHRREPVGTSTLLVALGSLVGAAVYLANRRLLDGEVREGGPGWNFCRYLAVLWSGFLVYCAVIVCVLLVWSLLRGLPLVTLLLALLSTYLPRLLFWPLVCLALLGYLLRVNSVVEVGSPESES